MGLTLASSRKFHSQLVGGSEALNNEGVLRSARINHYFKVLFKLPAIVTDQLVGIELASLAFVDILRPAKVLPFAQLAHVHGLGLRHINT